MEALLHFLVCLLATTAGAIAGVGGGVLIKPVLDAVSSMEVAAVSFASGCTVLAMSIVSLLRQRGAPPEERVERGRGTQLALGAAVGGLLGKWLFGFVGRLAGNANVVGLWQNIIMVVMLLVVLAYTLRRERIHTKNLESAAAIVLTGLSLGLLSAFLGIGGGPLNLIVLRYLFSMDTKQAAINSIYIIFFSQTASFLSSLVSGVPALSGPVLALMILGGVLGGILGRSLSARMSGEQVDRLFLGFTGVITLVSVYNAVSFAVAAAG